MPYKPNGKPRGRPKGSTTKAVIVSPEVRARIHAASIPLSPVSVSPLEVILQTMEHFYCTAPTEVQALFTALKVAHEVAKEEGNPAEIKRTATEMLQAYKELKVLRLDAVQCAVQGANYVHPRLQAKVQVPDGANDGTIPIDPHYEEIRERVRRYKARIEGTAA